MTEHQHRFQTQPFAKQAPTRQDDEEVLHAMRFLGTDSPEQASQWLAECEQRRTAG